MLSIHNVQNHAAVFTRMLLEPRLLDAVEQILDSPDILLHHTKAHLKPPGVGSAFPMHQDYHYFPVTFLYSRMTKCYLVVSSFVGLFFALVRI